MPDQMQGRGSMLSRTADNLYWLARYVERAEYLARILEVKYHMLLPEIGRAWCRERV